MTSSGFGWHPLATLAERLRTFPSVALPAARAELDLSEVWSLDQAKITKTARNLALVHLACAWLWLR
jgi:hypothetical protein